MAIPIRLTLTCPYCETSDEPGIADVSVGPATRTQPPGKPRYVMLGSPLWDQTVRNGETFISCVTCGAREFTSLNDLVRR